MGSCATGSARRCSAALRAAGAERLYTHQAEAINAALAGQNVVVATSTASGKTLCFNVPVLEALARDPLARALYLYPTKALAQDQLGKWQALVKAAGEGIVNPLAATYDGDTPQGARGRIRKQRARAADQPRHAARRHPAQPSAVGRVLPPPASTW